MTAGTRDAMPATSSRAPSGSRDLRATPPTTDAAATALESSPVDRDDRHHLAYGRRGKGFVGVPKHGVERERALDHAVATLRRELHQCGARLAGEDAELETGRVQGAAHAPPDVGDR